VGDPKRRTLTDGECAQILDEAVDCVACVELDADDPIFVGLCRHEWSAMVRLAYARGLQRAAEIAKSHQGHSTCIKDVIAAIDREREGRGGDDDV